MPFVTGRDAAHVVVKLMEIGSELTLEQTLHILMLYPRQFDSLRMEMQASFAAVKIQLLC